MEQNVHYACTMAMVSLVWLTQTSLRAGYRQTPADAAAVESGVAWQQPDSLQVRLPRPNAAKHPAMSVAINVKIYNMLRCVAHRPSSVQQQNS